jgi:hypothetical protein
MTASPPHRRVALGARWLPWLLGAALLAAVVWLSRSFTEERAFVQLLQ